MLGFGIDFGAIRWERGSLTLDMELLAYGQPASITEESIGLVQDFLLARTDAELSILSRLLGEERAGRVR